MKSMEQLEKMYEKEVGLSERHRKNAADIKKQMELQQGKEVTQKINSLKMSGSEYDRLMKLLSSGKKSILDAVELVLGEDEKNIELEEGGERVEAK